jgi:hypothetical protein
MDVGYLLMSLAGIIMLVGLCALLFGIKRASVTSTPSIEQTLARDVPGFRAGESAIARDKVAALFENADDGAIYLAVGRGDGVVTRKLGHGFVRNVARNGNDLRLKLQDFSLPLARITLEDESSARNWEARLSGLSR